MGKMRKHLLSTAAAIAMASPALAADLSGGSIPLSGNIAYSSAPVSTARAIVGDIELSLAYQDYYGYNCCGKSFNNFAFSGWGRANVPVGNWNLLVETGGDAFFGGDYPSGKSASSLNAFAHVWGGTGGFRYGVFGGATFGWWGTTWGSVGAEAEADFGNATVGAQGFYSWSSCCANPDIYGVNAWLDYYFKQNTKVTLTGQWASINDWYLTSDTEMLAARARFTHRFAGSPFNVFAEGQYAHFNNGPDWDDYAVVGGFTINLDGGMNQEELDKGGLPFSYRGPLPALGLGF